MNVVLDTNIFLSGIHWNGSSDKVLRHWFLKKFSLVVSSEILDELFRQLRDFKIQMPEQVIDAWEKLILEKSIFVIPKTKINVVKADPDDNKFIEAAIEGKASYIVSQDKHLLNIGEYQNIKIISPEEFLKLV